MTGVDRWRSSRRGWALTAAVLAATVCLACWPRPTLGVLGIVVGTGALLAGLRGLLAEHRSQAPAEPSDDLTAQEARGLADDLSLQLYRAADALDFVRECCDIADREGRQPTTAAVREWLRGAQCARQAGLVLSPAQGGAANESGERCCVCGGPDTPYENYRGQLFCWPCADCPCGQVPCVRTGINDPAVSSAAAEGPTCQCAGVGFGGRGDCPVHDGPTTPDASGQDPETTRTDPDASGEQRVDQAGDHPDASGQHAGPAHAMLAALAEAISALPAPAPRHPDAALRGRVAAVLLARIKQAVITDATPFGPGPVSTLIAATEYDLADVVLAELAPELDALAALHHGEEPYTDESTVPTPAQWIWRWNHATPAERLEYADCALTAAERLATAHHVVLRFGDRDDALAVQVRAALLGEPLPVVHRTTEQQASGPHQVDESAGQPGAVVHEIPITPPLTGPMIPTESPTCGTNLPATDGIPCAEPAAWHIRWATGDGDRFPAGLACQVHMDALAERHAWHERHAAGPDCGTRTANWQTDHCTPEAEA